MRRKQWQQTHKHTRILKYLMNHALCEKQTQKINIRFEEFPEGEQELSKSTLLSPKNSSRCNACQQFEWPISIVIVSSCDVRENTGSTPSTFKFEIHAKSISKKP